jgi:hypothetical protein
VRCESQLLDPADDEHAYLKLHLHCVRLRDNGFSWVVSLDTARRLRDQLTEHLDAAQATEADTCPGCGTTHGVQRITDTSPTVQAGMCAACGLHWATTAVVNPVLSIVGLLPTPQLRTAASGRQPEPEAGGSGMSAAADPGGGAALDGGTPVVLSLPPCRASMSWRRVSKAMGLAIDKMVTASKLGSHARSLRSDPLDSASTAHVLVQW